MSTLIDVLRTLSFFGVATFALAYHILAPWRETEVGRNIMTWTVSAALLLLLGELQLVFGPGWWFDGLRVLAFTAFAGAAWWRLVMLLKAQQSNLS